MIKHVIIQANINPDFPFEKEFMKMLKSYYSDLFDIIISESSDNHLQNADGIFSFQPVKNCDLPLLAFSHNENADKGFFVDQELLSDSQTIFKLSQYLNQFYQSIANPIFEHFPFQVRIADKEGRILSHNQQFNGSFFPDQAGRLEPWIYQQLADSERADDKHLLLASASLDHIYFQSYYAVKDTDGHYLGSVDLVQDLKPILSHYLEETAQAIVGWSDVTSGPSLSDDY